MPSVIQLVARLAPASGVPSDTVENVIHVGSSLGGSVVGDIDEMCQAFRDFYIATAPGATNDLGTFIGDSVSRAANACSILAYFTPDLTGQTPFGSPVTSLNFTMSTAAVPTPLPEEVSACISYNADLTNVPVTENNPTPPPAIIRPQQRRRGRLYFGPLQGTAGSEVNNIFRPTTVFRTDLGLAFAKMAQDMLAIAVDYALCVWSKADGATYPVIGGYVDDAWDTQRRRGPEATVRTHFSV